MFKVYFVNFNYYANYTFDTFDSAFEYVKATGYEAVIYRNSQIVASWSIIGGLWKEAV